MEIILSTFYALIFFLLIRRFPFLKLENSGRYASEFLFALKLSAGIGLGLIYTFYYTDRHTADTFRLFDDSAIIFNTLQSDPKTFFRIMTGIGGSGTDLEPIFNRMNNWYDVYSPVNDNRFMVRLNTILRFFSFGNYYVHVVFVSFLSFTGTVALIKFVGMFNEISQKFLWVIFGLLPSVLFWGSGLMKDAIVVFSMGMTLYYFGKMIKDIRPKTAFLFIFWFILLVFSRFQIAMVILPGILAWVIFRAVRRAHPGLYFLSSILLFFMLSMNPLLNIPELLAAKQSSFTQLAMEQEAGSFIGNISFTPDLEGILIHTPQAFIRTLTRPFIFDLQNPLMALSAIENMIILLFGCYCILNAEFKGRIQDPLFLFSVLFVVVSFTLIGLVTPVLGAMVRYKTPALPFLLLSFTILLKAANRKAIEHKFDKIKLLR